MDDQVPGGVYLCQVSAQVSCGACCGLYNVADLSRENLTRMLERRTRCFSTYFCDTTKDFAPRWKRVLRQVLDDWYLFGLVVTETDLLTAVFSHLESLIEKPLDVSMAGRGLVAAALKLLLRLKCRWPFRPASHGTACHYLFSDNAYPKPAVDYHRHNVAPSAYDSILRQMPSVFPDEPALRRAEALIEEHLAAVVQALTPKL